MGDGAETHFQLFPAGMTAAAGASLLPIKKGESAASELTLIQGMGKEKPPALRPVSNGQGRGISSFWVKIEWILLIIWASLGLISRMVW